jgi:endogenous inhibitor of DNA gyrase (YacG/DUF329 family)
MPTRNCKYCQKTFVLDRPTSAQFYCSLVCRNKAGHSRKISAPGHYLTIPLECPVCQKKFYRTEQTGPMRKYCSKECSEVGYKTHRTAFHVRNPKAHTGYYKNRVKAHGRDSGFTRLYRWYPDLPRCCEAVGCGESRVLTAAHKPEFKRNGSPRTKKLYERHMFWILCPTCHTLLDRGICSPEELGLIPGLF